ncbi:hypothetical protein OHA37_26490 [Streptomyces sp. NBC_00335]|uniref:SCO2400 family protein n=1 Tax=unclassified Streptomyces TaxID=2593676 RepID=UPI002258E3FC|nr:MULTISPECIES: hypothetical protein [unclassified Streptomyces]MCX5407399.1 hypothetical protein [Streptomyces sp. NBC_00086]
MDYCIACRRYLNGALACAGCGTPAERLISAAPVAPAPGSAAVFGSDPAALADVYADSLVVLSGEPGHGQGRAQGRAAARRRTGHRRRRRTALTVGLGLVLAAGVTLGMARLATDGARTDRAATVVLTDDAAPAEPAPGLTGDPVAPSGTASAKGPAAGSAKATAGGTKQGGTGRSTGGSTAGASGSASGAGPSRSASRTPTSAAPTTSGAGGSPSPSASASSKGPKGKPGGKPTPSPTPTPTPRPTVDCWWFFC